MLTFKEGKFPGGECGDARVPLLPRGQAASCGRDLGTDGWAARDVGAGRPRAQARGTDRQGGKAEVPTVRQLTQAVLAEKGPPAGWS